MTMENWTIADIYMLVNVNSVSVWKYGSTFNVGMDQVYIGHLYWERLCENHSKVGQNIYMQ